MKNASPTKGSTAGRQSRIRPGAKAATKPKDHRAEQKKTPSQTLKDSEVRYRRLFEAAQDGILILDAQTGAIDDVNPYLIDLLGYSHAEFVKKKLWEVGALKDIDTSKIAFKLLQENRYIRYKNLPLRTKDGRLIQVEFVSNVYLADGRKIIQCNIRDGTDLARVNDAFRANEKLYRSLFDNMLNGITYCKMIFEQGRPLDFIYLDVNSIFESLIGLKDVVGKKASEVLSGIRESDPGLIELFGRVALTGKPERCETYVEALKMWFSISVYAPEQDYFVAEYDAITDRKQAEEEIKKLAKFPGENPYPVLRLNEKGIILYANTASRALLEEWKAAIGQEAPSFLRKKATEALANRSKQVMEISIGARIITFVVVPIIEENYVNLYGEDITERKQAEETLRTSELRYKGLFEDSPIALWEEDFSVVKGRLDAMRKEGITNFQEYFTLHPESVAEYAALVKVLDVNKSAIKLLGANKKEDLFGGLTDRLKYERNHEFQRELINIAGDRTDFGWEGDNRTLDGRLINVDLRWTAVPGHENTLSKVIVSMIDITERIHAEGALRKALEELEMQVQQRTAALSQSNMLLQTLLDNTPDQIYFKDAESRFIRNSRAQAAALGLSDPSEVVGKTDFDFFPHAQRSYDEEQEIIRSGKLQVDFEEQVVWPDGHETWVSTTKVPLRDREDKIIGTFGISRDITGRKRNEEALRKARDELEAFSYSVSHDLRAPLRGIDGWSLALLEDYGGRLDEQGQEYIKRVRAEAQHMDQLIDDLLQLSRITRAEMHSDRVDLSASARSIAARLQEGEPQRRVEFIIQDGLSTMGDAHLLDVMLTNLLSNAFKFTGKVADARIEFGQMDMEGQRVFFVRDNGAGFDMAYAKKLFGAFQRMHKASEFPGTGIGLATVQRIINRHGGSVWAESVVNQGATFFFTL